MAQKIQVEYVDDIDGGKADETVTFGLDGKAYEIDLSAKNAEKLRKAVAPYLSAGRRAGRIPRQSGMRRSQNGSGTSNGDAGAIRAWAIEQGYEVSSRGRIPAEIQQAYAAAQ